VAVSYLTWRNTRPSLLVHAGTAAFVLPATQQKRASLIHIASSFFKPALICATSAPEWPSSFCRTVLTYFEQAQQSFLLINPKMLGSPMKKSALAYPTGNILIIGMNATY
jgi:hypothetical protein